MCIECLRGKGECVVPERTGWRLSVVWGGTLFAAVVAIAAGGGHMMMVRLVGVKKLVDTMCFGW